MSVWLSADVLSGDHLVSPRLRFEHQGLYRGEGRVIPCVDGIGSSASELIERLSHSPQTSPLLLCATQSLGNPWLCGAMLPGRLIDHLVMGSEGDDE